MRNRWLDVLRPWRTPRFEGMLLTRGDDDLPSRLKAHEFVSAFLRGYRQRRDEGVLGQREAPFRIWLYWAQGFDQAPAVVRACRRRLHALNPNADIVELTDHNLGDHIELPGYIFTRIFENKTHFSDILRCALLARYGGIWADATCYCSQPLSSLFDSARQSFFAYTRTDVYLLSSWFLVSAPGNIIPLMLRDALFAYWSASYRLENYFWFHYLFEALHNLNDDFRRMWARVRIEDSMAAHALQGKLSLPYDGEKMSEILETTHIQKLTYKIDDPAAGSYWHQICQ